jgi:hypothetical protein
MPNTEPTRSNEFAAGGAALSKLAGALIEASDFHELERALTARYPWRHSCR